MIHRSKVQRPPFEMLRSLYAGAVGMSPEPPEMLPVPTPRHAVGVDVVDLDDMEAAVHAARARAACNSARRALRNLARADTVTTSAAVSRRDQLEAMRSAAAVARREALR